jgi:hypothetical protein
MVSTGEPRACVVYRTLFRPTRTLALCLLQGYDVIVVGDAKTPDWHFENMEQTGVISCWDAAPGDGWPALASHARMLGGRLATDEEYRLFMAGRPLFSADVWWAVRKATRICGVRNMPKE